MLPVDVLDAVAGLAPDSPLVALRARRPEFVQPTQGSYEVLITPADPGGVSLIERAAAALRVAALEHDQPLIALYRGRLRELGGDDATVAAAEYGHAAASTRLQAILHHVTLVTTAPRNASKTDLETLQGAGLAARDIVALSQLVAFVSHQIRVAAGMRAMAQEIGA